MPKPQPRRSAPPIALAIAAALALGVAAVYAQVADHEFVLLDDPTGSGLSLSAGASIWRTDRSWSGATPTSRAFQAERSARVTRMVADGRMLTAPAPHPWRKAELRALAGMFGLPE